MGGGLTHPRLQHWLWERVWDFLVLGGPTSSISRRVVKLTVSRYYSAPLPLQKRGYGDEIRNPVVFMIPSTGSGSGVGGRGMHNGCDFWELERRGKLPFKAIFQQLGKYFCTPIMKSFVLQVQGDLLMRNQVAQGRGGKPP